LSTFDPSITLIVLAKMSAEYANAAVEGIVDNLNEFNMSSIAWDNATLLVPTNTTNCLRPGAMPIPLYDFNCQCRLWVAPLNNAS
jgi:hypothetical protein